MKKPETLEQFAQHYREAIARPPNGWGQHVSPLYGQSHEIMRAAIAAGHPADSVYAAFSAAVKDL